MRLLFLCLVAPLVVSAELDHKRKGDPCHDIECRAGRECVVVGGDPECLCATVCPDHFTPVCGTDNKSYDNHCLLHRHACIEDYPISIKHKGFCKKEYYKKNLKYKSNYIQKMQKEKNLFFNDIFDRDVAYKKKVAVTTTTTTTTTTTPPNMPFKKSNSNSVGEPAVCYSAQRDTLRDLIIQHWEITLKTQPWHVLGMSYRESLWGRFFTCDTDKDNYLIPDELFVCTNDTYMYARPEQDDNLTKALCIDALVDDGDKNQDWRLDFEEFTHTMDPLYHPEPKQCSLEGKKYKDGNEVHVDCNHCVCAVGNWVCTSKDCPKFGKSNDDFVIKPISEETNDDNDLDDDDEDDYDDDDDDDDYDVDKVYEQLMKKKLQLKKDTKMGKKALTKATKSKKKDLSKVDKKIKFKSLDDDRKIFDYDDDDDDDDDYDEYDYYEEDDDNEEVENLDNYSPKKTKNKMSFFEGFLLERAAKRKINHEKNDPWDDFVIEKKSKNHENNVLDELEDPTKTHLRRFLHDNLL